MIKRFHCCSFKSLKGWSINQHWALEHDLRLLQKDWSIVYCIYIYILNLSHFGLSILDKQAKPCYPFPHGLIDINTWTEAWKCFDRNYSVYFRPNLQKCLVCFTFDLHYGCINFIHLNLCIQSWNLTFYNNDSQNTLKEVAFALKCVLLIYHFWFSFRPSNQHLHSPLSVKITGISSHFCPLLTSSFFWTLNSFKQSWSMVRCQNIFF